MVKNTGIFNYDHTHKFDITCMGNALIDIFIPLEKRKLINKNLIPGSMTLISEEEANILQTASANELMFCGGSAANTAAGIAAFGGNVNFIGKIKSDSLGRIFYHEMLNSNVNIVVSPSDYGASTGRSYIMISPDKKERTMCTYLGAAGLDESDFSDISIKNSKILFVEGYLWDQEKSKKAALKALSIAHQYGVKIAFTLADSFCVKRHQKKFQDIAFNKADILFGNQKEAAELFGATDFEEIIKIAQQKCKLAVFTLGAKGSIVIDKESVYSIKSRKLANIIDTTGAGDLYAAGILYGLSMGMKIEDCAKIANIASSEKLGHCGSHPKSSLSKLLTGSFI